MISVYPDTEIRGEMATAVKTVCLSPKRVNIRFFGFLFLVFVNIYIYVCVCVLSFSCFCSNHIHMNIRSFTDFAIILCL